MSNTLFEELNIVQNKYLSLLKEIGEVPTEDISLSMIDSVNVFWYENRNIVRLVFDYLFKARDTYCFSAATIFDVDDRGQDSFFLLGEYHVFDDPIPSYLNTVNGISDKIYLKKMKSIISDTIKDNIRILEEMGNHLFILPLRYSSVIVNRHAKELNEIAENLFCNLFTNISNIEEYRSKVVTTDDLVQHFDKHNSAFILLFEGDNPSESWENRIEKFKEENDYLDKKMLSNGDLFFMAVYGNLRQALALFDMADTFGVIPFIRSFIPLHYYILLVSTLESNLKSKSDITEVKNSLWKTKVSYFLYREFRKREFNYSLDELIQKARDIDFENKIFNDLDYPNDNQEISETIDIVNKFLDKFV